MAYSALVIIYVIAAFILIQCECKLTQAQKEYILQKHVTVRKNVNPPALNMAVMRWNDELAALAQNYADQCNFHKSRVDVGLNRAIIFKDSPERAVDIWARGGNQYSYSALEGCSTTCQYIQMIWAKSATVGCGAAVCEKIKYSGMSPWLVTCFYSPPGNIIGEKPYETA